MKPFFVAAHTLGCKVNQCDTDSLLEQLTEIGCQVAVFEPFANLFIINTCTVTHVSDKKCRQMIRRAKKNPYKPLVAVCGCMTKSAPTMPEALGVDFVFDARSPQDFIEWVSQIIASRQEEAAKNIEAKSPDSCCNDMVADPDFEQEGGNHGDDAGVILELKNTGRLSSCITDLLDDEVNNEQEKDGPESFRPSTAQSDLWGKNKGASFVEIEDISQLPLSMRDAFAKIGIYNKNKARPTSFSQFTGQNEPREKSKPPSFLTSWLDERLEEKQEKSRKLPSADSNDIDGSAETSTTPHHPEGNTNIDEPAQVVDNNKSHHTDELQAMPTSKRFASSEDFKPLSQVKAPVQKRTRAFIKIQDGCDRFCSYCIVPYVRGNPKSRPWEDIYQDVTKNIEKGAQEIVLTGIQIAAYGQDANSLNLPQLIAKIAKTNIKRLRLSSIEPCAINPEFLQIVSQHSNICSHFHLSLQSGSDTVLERMNRRYTTAQYLDIVQKLRQLRPNTAITTDIIVGFPGETEAEFEQTLNFVKQVAFANVHVFEYSKRQGTVAATMDGQVADEVRIRRRNQLTRLVEDLKIDFLDMQVGNTATVLLEQEKSSCKWYGYTENYCNVEVDLCDAKANTLIDVQIVESTTDGLIGQATK